MEAARLMHITKVKQPRREADTINANVQTSKDRQRGRRRNKKRNANTHTVKQIENEKQINKQRKRGKINRQREVERGR